jgi:hypothetical protein
MRAEIEAPNNFAWITLRLASSMQPVKLCLSSFSRDYTLCVDGKVQFWIRDTTNVVPRTAANLHIELVPCDTELCQLDRLPNSRPRDFDPEIWWNLRRSGFHIHYELAKTY